MTKGHYYLMVEFTDEQTWLQAASILARRNYVKSEAGKEGNTIDVLVMGRAMEEPVHDAFSKLFPVDRNRPLPGQLPLIKDDES